LPRMQIILVGQKSCQFFNFIVAMICYQ